MSRVNNDAVFKHRKRDSQNSEDRAQARREQAHRDATERMLEVEKRIRQTPSGAAFIERFDRLRGVA